MSPNNTMPAKERSKSFKHVLLLYMSLLLSLAFPKQLAILARSPQCHRFLESLRITLDTTYDNKQQRSEVLK